MGCRVGTIQTTIEEPAKKACLKALNENMCAKKQKCTGTRSGLELDNRKKCIVVPILEQHLKQNVDIATNTRSCSSNRLSQIDLIFSKSNGDLSFEKGEVRDKLLSSHTEESQCNSKVENSFHLLLSLDPVENKLSIFDLKTMNWSYRDLNLSTVYTPAIGKQSAPKSFLKVLGLLSMLAFKEKKITFVGTVHFEYDIDDNCFYKKSPMKSPRECPLLNYSEGKIFAISGNKGSEASTTCEEYDCNEEKWKPIESLREPHVKGSSEICKDSTGRAQFLVVLGGYQTLDPPSFNPTASIFDFNTRRWTRIPLEEMTMRVPKLVNIKLVQSEGDKFMIFGTEYQGRHYVIDFKRKSLLTRGNLQPILPENYVPKIQSISYLSEKETIVALLNHDAGDQQKQQISKELLIRSKFPFKKWEILQP